MKHVLFLIGFCLLISCSKDEIDLQRTIITKARVFHIGIEPPDIEIGTANDVYINQVTMQYYVKSSQGWGDAYQLNQWHRSKILIGEGFPSESVGHKGDYFLDTSSGYLYGPKPFQSSWKNVYDRYLAIRFITNE